MFPQYDLTMGAPGNLLVDFTSLVVFALEATVEIRITPDVDSLRRQNGINVCEAVSRDDDYDWFRFSVAYSFSSKLLILCPILFYR